MRPEIEDTMLFWLTQVATEARKAAGRKQVHVAAALDRDQSTIDRFERAVAWPRDADAVISAYAEDLDMTAIELWAEALDRWRASAASTAGDAVTELGDSVADRLAAPAADTEDTAGNPAAAPTRPVAGRSRRPA